MKSKVSFAKLVCVFVLVTTVSVHATWKDLDTQRAGIQDGSWPEPAVIKIYTDAFTNPALDNFKAGVKAWTDLLTKVTVEYVTGDRPEGVETGIQLTKVPPGSLGGTLRAEAFIDAFFPPGSSHGNIDGGEIKIETDELDKSNVMKNIGTHEFGHILGLDENPRTSGGRTNAMDSDFNDDSPFLIPSSDEKTLIGQYYTVVPEPATIALLGLGGLALQRKRRAK